MTLKKFFNLPFIVLTLFILTFSFGNFLSDALKSNLYAISLFLKDFIVFILPLIIFSFVMSGILSFQGESYKIVLIVVPLVCLSNFIGFWVSYFCSEPLLETGVIPISKLTPQVSLDPAWHLPLVPFIRNDFAMIAAVVIGMIGGFFKIPFINKTSKILSKIANLLLKKGICPILPLFVLGFIIKMQFEGTLVLIAKEYAALLAMVALLAYGYMFFVMFMASSRNFKSAIRKFKNLLPGVLIGLCCMSSAAAIPNTIEGSEKNLENPSIAKFVVPATANMHLLGDCFALPIIALALMVSFGYPLPSVSEYFIFTLYGVIAKFAAAGIPGGSAIIFVPVFEHVFGFNSTMLTAVTAIYVLFDPIATSSSVFGHGMFAVVFEKVYNKLFKNKTV